MPLVREYLPTPDAHLYLWQISEQENQLPHPAGLDLSHLRAEARRVETLAVHAMLTEATGQEDNVIVHESSGRPTLPGYQLSVSHTRGWAALILSANRRVAVDIEYQSDRVLRITDRFLRPDEQRQTLEHQLVAWCAKEAAYKYYSEEDLQYFEMRLEPYTLSPTGRVEVSNLKSHQSLWVSYEVHAEYVLAYAVEQ